MKVRIEAKQITAEFWLATIAVSEPDKIINMRDFVVTREQLAFLRLLEQA